MQFPPASDYRYAFRKDDKGTDVAILQLNLPKVTVDGVFGKQTEEAVEKWQSGHKLVVDGIAGLATQRSIVTVRSREPTKDYELPSGLLKSIAFNESSFMVASAGPHLNDSGWDAGVFARSSGSTYGTDAFYAAAFNVKISADWTARNQQKQWAIFGNAVESRYLTELGNGDPDRFRWQLAILSHNWPAGAWNIHNDGSATPNDDAPAQWIINATRGNLSTPRQWVVAYVTKATVFVEWKD